MARFYFHTEDHVVFHDSVGAEFEDADDALVEAARRFGADDERAMLRFRRMKTLQKFTSARLPLV